MDNNLSYWQDYSIKLAKKDRGAGLRIGAILVSKQNEIVCTSHSDLEKNLKWDSLLIKKIKALGIKSASKLFVTINTMDDNDNFSINRISNIIPITDIFFGLPDPMLQKYCNSDPFIENHSIHRYEEKYQIDILNQNAHIYKNSPQNIANSPFYAGFRISHLLQEGLIKQGYFLEFDEIRQYTNIESLALSLSAHYNKDYTEMYMTIQKVLSSAFNTKYGSYSYENDTRSVDKSWHERFQNILCSVVNSPLHTIKIIDVGVGSGHEAIKLFSDYDNVTFIDIARDGLRIIESQMPKSKTYMLNAEQLTNISSSTYDLYVSLRTYNSSFFDIVKALNEAFRVLKEDGKIIISIANGFLRIENKTIIPGLIIPRTDFVDIYRGVNIAKNIRNIMQQIGFYKINIIPSEAEIYITAKKDN